MAAGLGNILRKGVAIAAQLTSSLQMPVMYAAVSLTAPGGPPRMNNEGENSWDVAVPLTAILEEKQQLVRKVDGTQQLSRFKMTILEPLVVNTLDRFTYADDNQTPLPPILATQATLDENGAPYAVVVYFG